MIEKNGEGCCGACFCRQNDLKTTVVVERLIVLPVLFFCCFRVYLPAVQISLPRSLRFPQHLQTSGRWCMTRELKLLLLYVSNRKPE